MKIKSIFVVFICVFLFCSVQSMAFQDESPGQKAGEKELSQKYRDFLDSTRDVMLPGERQAFLRLSSDKERDDFIRRFWMRREGQPARKVRENVRTLMMLRMTHALELNEEQTAKIFPLITRIEKEKIEIQSQILKETRELRLILRAEGPDEKQITEKIDLIKGLRARLKGKDDELESSIEENLTLVQRAKYLVFWQDFYQVLRDNLQRARGLQQKLDVVKRKEQ